jgi:hypothetical protein
MLKRTLLLLVVSMLTASAGWGQTLGNAVLPPAASGGRQPAHDALSASLNTHGGEPVRQMLSIRLTGTATDRLGAAQPFTVSSSLDGSTRIDYGSPATRSLITTPRARFDIVDTGIKGRPGHAGLYAQLDVFGVFAARSKSGAGKDRGVIGPGELNGRTTLRIRAGTDSQKTFYGRAVEDELDIEFDQQTGLIAAIHRAGYADESLDLKFVSTYAFSDYRRVQDSMWLPFRISRYLDGQLMETITVDAYDINPALSRDVFER